MSTRSSSLLIKSFGLHVAHANSYPSPSCGDATPMILRIAASQRFMVGAIPFFGGEGNFFSGAISYCLAKNLPRSEQHDVRVSTGPVRPGACLRIKYHNDPLAVFLEGSWNSIPSARTTKPREAHHPTAICAMMCVWAQIPLNLFQSIQLIIGCSIRQQRTRSSIMRCVNSGEYSS